MRRGSRGVIVGDSGGKGARMSVIGGHAIKRPFNGLATPLKPQAPMTRKHSIPLGIQVAFGFGAFMALIAAIMYGASWLPSPEQDCIKHCATLGGPVECRCS